MAKKHEAREASPIEEISGADLKKIIEEIMGPAGLDILGSLAGAFLFPSKSKKEITLAKRLSRLDSLIFQINKFSGHTSYGYSDARGNKVKMEFNSRSDHLKTSWEAERYEVGSTWKVSANYDVSKDKQVNFFGGISSYTPADGGKPITGVLWMKTRTVGSADSNQSIILLNIASGDDILHSVTLPLSSRIFRGYHPLKSSDELDSLPPINSVQG